MAHPADLEAQADPEDQVSISSDRRMITPLNLQVDPTDQADLEDLADQRRITQLEHQADLKDLAVLEDLEAQADPEDPADHLFLATRTYQRANCPKVYPVAQADPAVQEDQEAQVR